MPRGVRELLGGFRKVHLPRSDTLMQWKCGPQGKWLAVPHGPRVVRRVLDVDDSVGDDGAFAQWLADTIPGGGRAEAKEKFCVPKIDLRFWAPLLNHLEERLLDQAQGHASYTPPFWGSFA